MTPTSVAILACPMSENDAGAATVGGYLAALLTEVLTETEEFDGKRPFGNSGWDDDIYIALTQAGLITGMIFDEDGYVESWSGEDELAARSLVLAAAREALI